MTGVLEQIQQKLNPQEVNFLTAFIKINHENLQPLDLTFPSLARSSSALTHLIAIILFHLV